MFWGLFLEGLARKSRNPGDLGRDLGNLGKMLGILARNCGRSGQNYVLFYMLTWGLLGACRGYFGAWGRFFLEPGGGIWEPGGGCFGAYHVLNIDWALCLVGLAGKS